MPKVRCKFCINEKYGKCIKTKATVKLNKKRRCDKYIADEVKISEFLESRVPIKTSYVSAVRDRSQIDFNKIGTTVEHPLTGDLSKFVGVKNEK